VTPSTRPLRAFALALAGFAAAAVAPAQFMTGRGSERSGERPALSARDIIDRVGFEQRLGAQLPLDAAFRDDGGQAVRWATTSARGRWCSLSSITGARCSARWSSAARRAPRALSLSRRGATTISSSSASTRRTPRSARPRRSAKRWQPTVAPGSRGLPLPHRRAGGRRRRRGGRRLPLDEGSITGEFAHAAGLVVATPDGRVSRYLYGAEFAPRDLKLALVESSAGRSAGPSRRCCSTASATTPGSAATPRSRSSPCASPRP